MRLTRKNLTLLIGLILLLITYLQNNGTLPQQDIAGTKDQQPPTTHISPFPGFENRTVEYAVVTSVVDGDTIKLSDGRTLRYIGIDTPETRDPRRGLQCFGKEASARNSQLVLNQPVALEKDVSETDRYGRILRYVYLSDGSMINEILVTEGFAHASAYPPDIKYQDQLVILEQNARTASRGLWSVCSTP